MLKGNIHFTYLLTYLPKGTQYTGGLNFFVPDFNKLPDSLRSQGIMDFLSPKTY